jgi:hypothetical protein
MGAVAKAFDELGEVVAGAWRGEFKFGAVADDLAVGFGDLVNVFTIEDLVATFDLGEDETVAQVD